MFFHVQQQIIYKSAHVLQPAFFLIWFALIRTCCSLSSSSSLPLSLVLCVSPLAHLSAAARVWLQCVFSVWAPQTHFPAAIALKCRLEQALVTTCARPHTLGRDTRARCTTVQLRLASRASFNLMWRLLFFSLMWWQMRTLEVVSAGVEYSRRLSRDVQ